MAGATVTMSEYYTPADRLEEIARRCQAGEPLAPDHFNWLGAAACHGGAKRSCESATMRCAS
ncbi:MAG: hypothetical protein KAT39_02390 [Alphaproteobacteria bacterium]|nr:hypothetical protein [Alphaproteobacteria bacterium]